MSIFSNPTSGSEFRLPSDPLRHARVLWIRQETYNDTAGQLDQIRSEIYKQMHRQGLEVQWSTIQALSQKSLDGVDLVIIDSFDDFEGTVQMAAARVRIKSRVPLVMLTQGYSSQQLVLALRSGVDAILSCNTPPDLLIARCNALLRRWRSSTSTRRQM